MKVEYMCHSGDDLLVVDAARASFGKESEWETINDDGEGVLSYKDRNLINFLAREKHVLPFRHPSITLRCRAPIFVVRQLMKHQAGMSWSEESRRYITTDPVIYIPEMRAAAENVKQGSADNLVEDWEELVQEYGDTARQAVNMYNKLLDRGVAPEVARTILPVNMMVTWVWTGTLLAWHHMLKLRLASDTQKETQEFAKMVEDILFPLFPVSMEALREHG